MSDTDFFSLVMFLRKHDGQGVRKVVDFKLLNTYSRVWMVNFPCALATVRKIPAHWKMFTTLYLAQGYFHVPMCGVLSKLFSFGMAGGRYKYNGLPQGWSHNASAFHSRMCNCLVGNATVVYVDDIDRKSVV